MKRRQLLARSGVVAGGIVGVAGCLGSATASPPRESAVFEKIYMDEGALIVEFEAQPVVQSRTRLNTNGALGKPVDALASVSPIGVASGQATGTGTGDGPRGRNGRPKWQAGGHDEWWEKNGDKVTEYEAEVVEAGIGYFGADYDYEQERPGPQPLDWERQFNNPDQSIGWQADYEPGWYRIGARLEAAHAEHNFSWEYVDLQLVEKGAPDDTPANATGNATTASTDDEDPPLEIAAQWKVSAGL